MYRYVFRVVFRVNRRGGGSVVALTGEVSVMETQCFFCKVGSRVMRAGSSYSRPFAGQIRNPA